MKWTSQAPMLAGLAFIAAGVFGASTSFAQQVPVAADVIVVMDESGSMSGEQRWSADMIPLLDVGLQQYGIGSEAQTNLYGLVGFGNNRVVPRTLLIDGADMGSPEGFTRAAGSLVVSGGTEDGWRGIEYALDQYPRRNGAAVNIILVTDEDRDNTLASVTYQTVLQKLNDNGALLNAVVNARMNCGNGVRALGMDSLGTGYVADGSGGFTTCEGAYATSGAGRTVADYVNLAIENGGAAWDLNVLRSGGSNAQSFSNALLAIKIDEILSQRPTGDLVAVAQATPNPAVAGELITLDGTGSFHQKEGHVITSWEWDLDNDGQFDAVGPVITTRFENLGDYPVMLRVTDDSDTPLTATAELTVNVSTPPLPPTANSGGPYLFCPQTQPWYLDGSGSVNPDDGLSEENRPADAITAWEWDLTNNLAFDDAEGPVVDVTKHFSGLGTGDYLVRLRVTDNTAEAFPSSSRPDLIDTAVTQVRVRDESDAACNCLTDVAARPNMSRVQLTWSDTAAHAYGIYRSDQEGGPFERIATTDNRYSTYLDLGIELNTRYYYAVSELGRDGRDLCRSRQVSVISNPRGFNPANRPPVIESTPVLQATEGETYRYQVVATDPDPRDRIDYSLLVAPSGMTINSQSGQVEWTPVNAQVGIQNVIVRAADSQGAFAEQVFSIVVANVNQPPRIVSEPATAATELQSYSYQVQTLDPDAGDRLIYALEQAPSGMTIEGATGLISWTPEAGQAGVHPVTVKATDLAGESDIQTFQVRVTERNHLPVITSTPVILASVGSSYRYEVTATDDNETDALTFALGVFPDGMEIDPLTGEVLWTPEPGQEGTHSVAVVVSDDRGGSTSQNYEVVVAGENLAPIILTEALPDATRGQPYEFAIAAEDGNTGDVLRFSLESAPSNMVIDAQTGVITWLPVQSHVGVNAVGVRVTDSGGLSTVKTFEIFVNAPAIPLEIISTPVTSVQAGSQWQYQVVVSGYQDVELEYELVKGPAGMSINSANLITWTPGDDEGGYSVTVRVSNQAGDSVSQSFTLSVVISNAPPIITSNPPATARVGQLYLYQVVAQDPESGALSYSLGQAPAGMTLGAENGRVQWVPGESDEGLHPIIIEVADEQGAVTRQSFSLDVTTGNAPPSINSYPPSGARVGEMYSYQLMATDPENEVLTYSLVSGPSGMTLSSSGLLQWVPAAHQTGDHSVSVQVQDPHGASATQSFTLQVLAENRPPVFEGLPPTDARVGVSYSYVMVATDPDGDSLAWTLLSGPSGMAINAGTGQITWVPSDDQIGTHQVVVRVTDGHFTVARSYSVIVVGDMPPPSLGNVPTSTAEVGKQYVYRIVAIDGQGYTVDVELQSGPEGMVLANENGVPTIRWTPEEGDCIKTVRIKLEDRFGQTTEPTWDIQVYAAPRKHNRIQCSAQSQACGG